MKVFVGCSSYEDIDSRYFIEADKLADVLIKNNCEVMMGCCNRGLMGLITNKCNKNNLNVLNICIEHYKEDMEDVVGKKLLVGDVDAQLKIFMQNDYLIYAPGGYGTYNELFYMVNAYVLGNHKAKIILINTTHYYDEVKSILEKIENEKFAHIFDIVTVVDNFEELDNILKGGKKCLSMEKM